MPLTTRDVIADLGLPGIADIHVHAMPPQVMAAVWRYFESAGPLLGREWPVRYRGSDEERLTVLRAAGVELFAPLAYAHKPGMAAFLTDWSLQFAAAHPGTVATGSLYPDPDAADLVAGAIERGCQLFKLHLQVGDVDPRAPELDEVWGLLATTGIPVVVHAGSGPVAGRFTGPGPLGEVLARHPHLPAIVAHLGSPEEAGFLELAARHPALGLDLTMVGTDFFGDIHRMDPALLPVIRDLGLAGRVFFGSDFPNIPYSYDHAVEALVRWDLGDDWLAAVLWHNTAGLLGATA